MVRLCALLTFLFWFDAVAQISPEFSREAEEEFTAGINLFKKADYKSAAAIFQKVAEEHLPNQRTTAAFVMKAKAELYGGDVVAAERTLQTFIRGHGSSRYGADAFYTRGLIFLKTAKYDSAGASFVSGLRSLDRIPSSLKQSLLFVSDETIDRYCSLDLVRQLLSAARQPAEEEYLLIKLGEKQLVAGDRAAARTTLERARQKFPRPAFSGKIAELETRLSQPVRVKLGVILPAVETDDPSGFREKEVGTGLLEGIRTARLEFASSLDVSIEVRDTRGDAGSMVRELAADGSVIGILGPAFSRSALAAASAASEQRIVVVTPTANASGIAASSEFMFQANPDLETRARAIAYHAVMNLKLKRLAILGADGLANRVLADAFTKEVQRLGSDVVADEWYPRQTTNLQQQLISLRKKGNAAASEPHIIFSEQMSKGDLAKLRSLGISSRVLDTLRAQRRVVNMTEFFGEEARARLGDAGISFSNGDPRIDSVQRITKAIQGLYCPISSAMEIGIIASQLAFYGITTQLLGSGEWNNAAELSANKRYSRGVVFESDYYVDTKSAEYAAFSARFVQQHNKLPSRYAVLGYDAAKLLLSLMAQGAATRERLHASLSDVRGFESLHARFTFGEHRVNSWLHILQYTNDGITHLSQMSVE